MKIDWCKLLGHKWIPVYVIGYFGKNKVKFLATECKRCDEGEKDLRDTINKMDNCIVCSYDKKYYNHK